MERVIDYAFGNGGVLLYLDSGRQYEINQFDFEEWCAGHHEDIELDYTLPMLQEFIEAGEPGIYERITNSLNHEWYEREKDIQPFDNTPTYE